MLQFACSPLSTTDDFFNFGCNCTPQLDDLNDVFAVSEAIEAASDLLMLISGGRVYGRCTATVFPIGGGGNCPPFDSVYPDGAFGGLDVIPLRGPYTEIIEVRIDGAALATSSIRLIDGRFLARVDGEGWPSGNSFDVSDDQSWTITYRHGFHVDKITRDATNELACELIKNYNERKSLLPLGVTSLNLQGVSAQLEDAADALRDGSENMPAVARFLAAYNPADTRVIAGVYSPELDRGWQLFEMTGPSGS